MYLVVSICIFNYAFVALAEDTATKPIPDDIAIIYPADLGSTPTFITKDHIYYIDNAYKFALFMEVKDYGNYTEYKKGEIDPERCARNYGSMRRNLVECSTIRGWASFNFLKENCPEELDEDRIILSFRSIPDNLYFAMKDGKVYDYDIKTGQINTKTQRNTEKEDNINYFKDASAALLPSLLLVTLLMILLI